MSRYGRRYTSPGPLLDHRGQVHPGWSTGAVLRYDRAKIKSPPWRVKEWDFYQISNRQYCLQLVVGGVGYAGQVSAALFDFTTGERIVEYGRILPLAFGSLHMPASAEADGVLEYDKHGIHMRFEVRGAERRLRCRWGGFSAQISLRCEARDSIAVNIPFKENPRAFYYNQKINLMRADGWAQLDGRRIRFSPADSWGLLDWGRGVWPFHNEWYWSNGSGLVAGKPFGFNLGCGFGDTSHGTENILFYGGRAHKLGEVAFELDKADYMRPWHLRDGEGRLDLTLAPVYDRTTVTKLLFVDNEVHQMFGRFDGYAVLDDGTRLEINDLTAFAEHAKNRW